MMLVAMDQVAAPFTIWSQGCKGTPRHADQPARLASHLPYDIYVGDLDDVANISRLQGIGIGTIVNLCPDMLFGRYAGLPADLAAVGIVHVAWPACDRKDFDIVRDVLLAGAGQLIDARLRHSHVLVNCWAGTNRGPAVAIGYLVLWHKHDILETFAEATQRRGTVLTNRHFRHLLAQQVDLETGDFDQRHAD